MADSESGYKVGPGRPPLHARFKQGQSGNPGGRSAKSLPALLADALNETVVRDDRRTAPQDHQARGDRHADGRQIGECRSARDQDADRHDERRRAQGQRRCPAPEPRRLAVADKEVVQQFAARLRRQILQEIEEAKAAGPSG